MAAEVITIDINAQFRDQTASGVRSASSELDRFNRSISRTQEQTIRGTNELERMWMQAKKFGSMAISIPVKLLDYATKPLRSMIDYATSLKGILTGIVVGQVSQALVVAPTQMADQIESAKIFFERKLGSLEESNKFLQEIYKFDESSPFNTMQIIDTVKSMMGVGWTRDNVLKDVGIIGDASSALGLGTDGVESISRQMGQMRMKMKVSQEEINVLNERGINAWQYIAEGMGFGSDSAAMMQAREYNDDVGIMGEQAVQMILDGMQREYGGSSTTMADETLSGILGQLESVFQSKVALKWGEGLAEGAKVGFVEFKNLINENTGEIEEFGEDLFKLGKEISLSVANFANETITKTIGIFERGDFQRADIFGKINILWDEIIADPFLAWWESDGQNMFEWVGENIGGAILKGATKGFSGLITNAAAILPGGQEAGIGNVASAGLLLSMGSQMGLGSVVNAGGSAAMGGLGALGIGALPLAAILAGGGGLGAAIADFNHGSNSKNEKEQQDSYFKGGARMGMVGAGAAIGTLIAPGVGTAIGTLVGGLGAILAGGSVGQWLSDTSDGTQRLKDMNSELDRTRDNMESVVAKEQNFSALADQYELLEAKLKDTTTPAEEVLSIQEQMKTVISEMAGLYPDLITQYDIENGKLGEKLGLLKQLTEEEKKSARMELTAAVSEGQLALPEMQGGIADSRAETERLLQEAEKLGKGSEDLTAQKVKMMSLLQEAENIRNNKTLSDTDRFSAEQANETERYNLLGDIEKTLLNTTGVEHGFQFSGNTAGAMNAIDQVTTDYNSYIQGAQVEMERTAELEAQYNNLYDSKKALLELDMGMTFEEGAGDYYKLSDEDKAKFDDALSAIQELESLMSLLPDEKRIDITLQTNAPKTLAPMSDSAIKESMPSYSSGGLYNPLRGYSTGTMGAGSGLKWVGENGPEIVDFSGGEKVYNAQQSQTIANGLGGGVNVSLGGMNFTVSGSNANDIMAAIKSQMPAIADEVANTIAIVLKQQQSNTPVSLI